MDLNISTTLEPTSWLNRTSEQHPDSAEDFAASFRHAGNIRATFAVITLILSSFGNSLTFVLMRKKPMRNTSAGIYFGYIAIADTLTVYFGQLLFLVYHINGVDLISIHPWSCRWTFFLLFTIADVAVWLLVAVTVDRFIAISFPLKMKQLCTPFRAHIVCVTMVTTAIAKNLHLFWTRGVQEVLRDDGRVEVFNCGWPTKSYEYFGKYVRPWIAFSLYAFIPISGIFVLNIIICYKLIQMKKKVKPGKDGDDKGQSGGDKKGTSQITAMLLSVSIVFLILIIPSITVLIAKPYVVSTLAQAATYAYVEAVVDTMAYFNHSINFFLYCLTGAGFRKEAKKLLFFWRPELATGESTITNTKVTTHHQ